MMDVTTPIGGIQPAPSRFLAPLWHTAVLIAFLLLFSALGSAGHPGLDHSGRLRLYIATMLMEWAMVGFIAWGLRLSKRVTVRDLIGGKWEKPEDFLLDVAVAVGFWIIALGVLALVGVALGMNNPATVKTTVKEMQQRIGSLLPTGQLEIAVWILLSVTAGFCEEVIYRGYFQRQLTGLFGTAWIAIIAQGVIFGASHGYEGIPKMIQIAVFGILFGLLAHWRKSLRPGMMAHAAHDTIQGIFAGFVLKNADKVIPK
jgi:hypothetical protein